MYYAIDISIISIPVQCGFRLFHIGVLDCVIQSRVRHILVIVVARFLSNRVRRIADNHLNRCLHLLGGTVSVWLKQTKICRSITCSCTLSQLESIRQHDSLKRDIVLAIAQFVIGFLNVDRCNVVGQQNDFVAMDFAGVLVQKILRLDDATAQQLNNEGTCTSERVYQDLIFDTKEKALSGAKTPKKA